MTLEQWQITFSSKIIESPCTDSQNSNYKQKYQNFCQNMFSITYYYHLWSLESFLSQIIKILDLVNFTGLKNHWVLIYCFLIFKLWTTITILLFRQVQFIYLLLSKKFEFNPILNNWNNWLRNFHLAISWFLWLGKLSPPDLFQYL